MLTPSAHAPAPPFAHSAGSRQAKVALVGEAWGADEMQLDGQPFVGAAGQELMRLVCDAGLTPQKPLVRPQPQDMPQWWESSGLFLTNVIAARPFSQNEFGRAYTNDFEALCTSRENVVGTPAESLPALNTGKYLKPEFVGELARLNAELAEVKPNIVVALGGKSAWALLGNPQIGRIRGTTAMSANGIKVICAYHPSYLLRGSWADRPVVLADLMKARREAEFPEIRRPERWVLVAPTLSEMEAWRREHLTNARVIGIDIETARGQITCVGFAPSARHALCVPFVRPSGRRYWDSPRDERAAWEFVRQVCASDVPKVFQNGAAFDGLWLFRAGITIRGMSHDTMLAHHALHPELPKNLGFLASIYADGEQAWKLMRGRHTSEAKRDDA